MATGNQTPVLAKSILQYWQNIMILMSISLAEVLIIQKTRLFFGKCLETPQFLQPFSIDSAAFPCRDPAISSTRSFHGVKICSVCNYKKYMQQMVLNVWTLSEVELLQFVAPNLWFRIGRRDKISLYIQPSNLSSAL